MEEYLYCLCGHPIKVVHNEGEKTCRTDGQRFVDMKKPDTGWCLFRCPSCSEVVEKENLVELGVL